MKYSCIMYYDNRYYDCHSKYTTTVGVCQYARYSFISNKQLYLIMIGCL